MERKVKEYNYKDNIIFEGEYLNGKINGKGKEYDDDGNLIFEGQYSNGNKIINLYSPKYLISLVVVETILK